jgi:hypothetical protein
MAQIFTTEDTEVFTTTRATRATPEGEGWGETPSSRCSKSQVFSFKLEAVLVLDLCQTPNLHTSTHRFEYE